MTDYDYLEIEHRDDGSFKVTPKKDFSFEIGAILFGLMILAGISSAIGALFTDVTTLLFGTPTEPDPIAAQIEDYGFVWLNKLGPIGPEDHLSSYDFYDTVDSGNTVTHCLRAPAMLHGGYGEGSVEYSLGRSYSTLTGTLAITKEFENTSYSGFVRIYSNGKLVYEHLDMVSGDQPVHFRVNVADTDHLLIEHGGGEAFRVGELKLYP